MKNFFKRFKLSEWLIVLQLVLSALTLILTTFLGDTIVDIIGLIGNIVNALAILVVFSMENSRNVKYYEMTGQFIFNKLGESFSSFMDFLMSEEYKKMPFDEHNVFRDKLLETATSDNYDVKRKISRALPYLYDIDKSMTMDIIQVLRQDMYNGHTDVRRRTLEALVTIIQKEPNAKKQRRMARRFFEFFKYHNYDDSYTVVACIECYYFVYDYVFSKARDKKKCMDAMGALKTEVKRAYDGSIGIIDECLVNDLDNVWQTLVALSGVQNVRSDGYVTNKAFVENVLANGAKFSKLTVVKNLFYTCENFPDCLHNHSCSASASKFMMEKINRFLTNALDKDVYLAMPTVRYFDCVCNNISRGEAKAVARAIIREYFSSSELIITQTAFDKFAKLLAGDYAFAKEILDELLIDENELAIKQSSAIQEKIASLPEDKRAYFSVETGRTKIKEAQTQTHRMRVERNASVEVQEIDKLIKRYNERVRFIGKIKKFKEDNRL